MLSALVAIVASAHATTWPTEEAWTPLTVGGAVLTDPLGDHSGGDPVDLVGDELDPVGAWTADDQAVYLRLRIDDDPWQSSTQDYLQSGSWAAVLDLDGDPGAFELAVVLTGPAPTVFLYEPSSGEGLDAILTLTSALTPSMEDLFRITESDSITNGNADWTVDFALPRDDLESLAGVLDDSVFQVALATGQYSGATTLDGDLAGVDGVRTLADGLADSLTIDADGDGLTDPEEAAAGTDPDDSDSDDDGLSDADELWVYASDPAACDGDSDGLLDSIEVGATEAHDDGEADVCFTADADPSTTTDALSADTDLGGVPDGSEDWDLDGAVGTWEIDPELGSDDADTDGDGVWDALEARCTLDGGAVDDLDSDADGIDDATEWLVDSDGDGWADFCDEDSDGDGTPDAEEADGDSDCDGIPDLLDDNDQDGDCGDLDADGLINSDEPPCGTDPEDPDTDGDGLLDGDEDCLGDDDCDGVSDPLDSDPTNSSCEPPEDDLDGDDPLPGTFDGGEFTGGSCSTLGAGPALAPALLSLLALFRRRGCWLALLASPAALAAETDGAAEPLDAQRFEPAPGGGAFFAVTDPHVGDPMSPGAALVFNVADDPLVFRYDDPDREELAVLDRVATANLVGWFGLPRLRVALDLPLHVYSSGYQQQGFKLVGDLRALATVQAWQGPLGPGHAVVGLTGRLTLPSGQEEAWLGEASTTAGLTVDGRYDLGPVRVAATAGFHTGTWAQLGDVVLGHRLPYALGVSYAVTDAVRIGGELDGEKILGSSTAGSRPLEVLATASYQVLPELTVRGGVGTGLTQGIGAPDWRLVAAVVWHPGELGTVFVSQDSDGDGIVDELDLCRDQPEDHNGIDDQDGCPDGGLTPTRVRVLDPAGNQVTGAVIDLNSGPWTGSFTLVDGELVRSLAPGRYGGTVEAEGFQTLLFSLEVPAEAQHEQSLRLAPVVATVPVAVLVRDTAGLPVQGTWVRALGQQEHSLEGAPDGVTRLDLGPGAWGLVISAPGFRTSEKALTVEPGQTASVEVVLEPARVTLEGDRVRILDKVYFELDSAEIKRESFSLLDEVAEVLLDHPELIQVAVHGHTDDQGDDTYNLELSLRRAQAVRRYLVQVGVAGDRLSAQGFGETLPLVQETTETARAANRRVEFHVTERRAAEGP